MKTVLIIENDPDILDSCCELLMISGYEILKASDGLTGINFAFQRKPNLILCDIIMPQTDGYAVLSAIQKHPSTKNIPIVFMSTNAEYDEISKALQAGAAEYIVKPFETSRLINSIADQIKRVEIEKRNKMGNLFSSQPSTPNIPKFEKLKKLTTGARIRQIKKKQALYNVGDESSGLYLVVQGQIKTIKVARDGHQLITGIYSAGDYIGLDTLLLNGIFADTAEAVEDSSYYLIQRNEFIDRLDHEPELSKHFLKLLSTSLQEKEEQLIELAYNSVRKRLAQVLVKLNRGSRPLERLNISREELAGLAGIATETVSRILKDFKGNGLIEKEGPRIRILDDQALIRIRR